MTGEKLLDVLDGPSNRRPKRNMFLFPTGRSAYHRIIRQCNVFRKHGLIKSRLEIDEFLLCIA
jgi:hypothetical protein